MPTKKKDWKGDSESVYHIMGASNHCKDDRETHDYYATDPKAVELLLAEESFDHTIWEPACGEGHISKVLEEHGYKVISTDLIDRGYGKVWDFLEDGIVLPDFDGDIITNPPYNRALSFAQKALEYLQPGKKLAMFLKLTFLEGKARKPFFKENPPRIVYVSSSRLLCAKNGKFEGQGSAVCYAWFIWEKGFSGDPIIKWIN